MFQRLLEFWLWLDLLYLQFYFIQLEKIFFNMHISTKKWLFTKISYFVLIPFMIWFILNFVSIYENDYQTVLLFFSQQPSKILFSIFIIIAYFFSALTVSEIFEDYIKDQKIKNVANKVLNIFAIIMPLITITGIYNLS